MAMGLKLQQKLTQQLVLTPQLQLSIKVLQLNHLELTESIDQEVQENPLLEMDESRDPAASVEDREFAQFMENYAKIREEFKMKDRFVGGYSGDEEEDTWELFATRTPDLSNHLLWQLHLGDFSQDEIEIGEEIIGNIDPDGYLRTDLMEIASAVTAGLDAAECVLKKIQQFDPVGIASRDLKECLLNQIIAYSGEDKELLISVVSGHLEDISRRNFKQVAKALQVEVEAVMAAFEIINTLNPKPARGYEFTSYENQSIQPDVYVVKEGDGYKVVLNFESIPSLKINRYYEKMLKEEKLDAKSKLFIQDKLKNAYWFIKSVQQRGNTILRVASAIVEKQRDFLDKGVAFMKPMTLKDVALELGLHESTISRVTSNKYMLTTTGLFEMKYFFSTGIRKVGSDDVASITVKQMVKEMTEAESTKSPLSDQEISDILKAKGYSVARRTVTKYREALQILPSHMRKR